MCSQYNLRFSDTEIAKKLQSLAGPLRETVPDRIFPQTQSPVLVKHSDGQLAWEWMRFGILPRWSQDERVKFATHNARIESVESKASFKEAFAKRHCLVPMSAFFEAVYRGPQAGHVLEFETETNDLLMAAGIWEEWVNRKSGELIHSFAVITRSAYPYISQWGHDRSPIFLKPETWNSWLENKKIDLSSSSIEAQWKHVVDRPLAKGWEKRIKAGNSPQSQITLPF